MSETIKPGQRLFPVLAMRGIVMFEGSLAHFDVGREKSLLALDYAMQHGRRILLVTQRDIMTENPTTDQLYQYGVLAEIKQMFKTQDGISRVLVECLQRIKLGKNRAEEPFLQANYRSAPIHPSEVEQERMEAAIGAGIGPCCFETHDDVPDAMTAAFGSGAKPFIAPRGEQWTVDLKGLNAWRLREAGVPEAQIDICPLCTACHTDLYWSHRKSGDRRGVQGALIGLKP